MTSDNSLTPRFIYDLDTYPATNDILYALTNVSCLCVEFGIERFSCIIYYGSYSYISPRNSVKSVLANDWRALQMLSQIPWAFPMCCSVSLVDKRKVPKQDLQRCDFVDLREKSTIIRDKHKKSSLHRGKITVDFWLKGYELHHIRPVSSSPCIQKAGQYITLSLRQSRFQESRNSSLEVLNQLLRYLSEMRIKTIIIPDYEDCIGERLYEALEGQASIEAATNPLIRLGLYGSSICNIGTSSGLFAIATFLTVPYFIVSPTSEQHNTSEKYLCENFGIRRGDSYLWSRNHQCLYWGQESLEAYKSYLALVGLI